MTHKVRFLIPFLMIVSFSFITSCTNDDDSNEAQCDEETLVNASLFETAPADPLLITELDIQGDCLSITFNTGGCDGSTWQTQLIDQATVLESDPPQRFLRLSLKNEEPCEALVTKKISFDISTLKVDGNRVQLNIVNNNESVLYSY